MSIDKFKNIFKGLERAHGCTKVGPSNNNGEKVKGQSFVVREPVTDELWLKHLQGTQSLGIIPINDDNECVWGCVDIDSYAGFDHKKLIDKIQYSKEDRGEFLPPSSYKLVHKTPSRGVYSFCMCPGGIIAPCATSPGEVVTNGWSDRKSVV